MYIKIITLDINKNNTHTIKAIVYGSLSSRSFLNKDDKLLQK